MNRSEFVLAALLLPLLQVPADAADPLLRNGDFSAGLDHYTTTAVAPGSFSGFPKFEETGAPCLPSQVGNRFLAVDVPGGADGYVEQQLQLPDETTTFRLRTWGNLQAVTATISIITLIDNVEHVLEKYTPPQLQATPTTCSGRKPVVKVYDLTPYRGQNIRVRLRATSTGNNGTFADFDDLSIIRGHGSALNFSDSVVYGPVNPATTGPAPCSVGDPVNCATGNLVESATDLFVAGRGRALRFTRTYNAMDAAGGASGPLGFGWNHGYAARLTVTDSGDVLVRQGNGSTVAFLPSGDGFVAPPFVIASLMKNPADGTYTFTLPDQRAEIFSGDGRLLAQTDRNGYRTTLTYTASGKLKSITDPAGRKLVLSYNGRGLPSAVRDPLGRRVGYSYDGAGNLVRVRDPGGHVTRYAYDERHRLIAVTDPNGGVVTNGYDDGNRVISQAGPGPGRSLGFAYGEGTTTITDGNGQVEIHTFAGNRLMMRTRGLGSAEAATSSFGYDEAGNLVSVTDPNGQIWRSSYDGRGNRLSQTDPLGRTTRFSYDGANNLLTRTDPMAFVTQFGYDSFGNLASISRPLVGAESNWLLGLQHEDAQHPGDITAVVDPDGQIWKLGYDASGNLVRREDPLGHAWTGRYNRIGWLTEAVLPRGNEAGAKPAHFQVKRAYSPMGDLMQLTDALGNVHRFAYDGNRNLLRINNGNRSTLRFVYNPDNRPIKAIRADGSAWTNGFDPAGNLVEQTDGTGAVTRYGYDALDRPVQLTDPLGRVTRFGYDRAGNRTEVQDPNGAATTLTYDAAGQLTGIAYSGDAAAPVRFAYDGNGRRTEMSDGSGQSLYQWDSLGRLAKHTDGSGRAVDYGYDLRGNLILLTYPNGKAVTRQFDAAGRLVTVNDWLGNTTTFHDDAAGNLTGIDYGNGLAASFRYDRSNRIIAIDHADPQQSLLRFEYRRNQLGQVRRADQEHYAYTRLNQLRAADDQQFLHDPADNLIRLGAAELSYDAANQLTGLTDPGGAWSYQYDHRGNRITAVGPAATSNYGYDLANRLVSLGGTVSYAFDGDGLRVRKEIDGVAQPMLWNVAESLPMLLGDGDHWFVYGRNGWPLEQIAADGSVAWFHQDQLGSTRMLSDAAGAELARYRYSPFGALLDEQATQQPATPLLFAGQYRDGESGLYYLRARSYDPSTGQFLSRDPLAGTTRRPYAYANGDPLNRVDPTGLADGPVVIMVNSGTFSMNGGPVQQGTGGFIVEGNLTNGVSVTSNAWISSPENLQICSQEQALDDAGHLAPGTHQQFVPLGGNPVSYTVNTNTHVSGDVNNPNTVNSAVAIVSTTVVDAQGHVVYQNQVVATASQGYSLTELEATAASNVNTFFQGAIPQNR